MKCRDCPLSIRQKSRSQNYTELSLLGIKFILSIDVKMLTSTGRINAGKIQLMTDLKQDNVYLLAF